VLTLPYNRPDLAVPLIEEHAADLAAVLVDPAPNRAGLASGTPEFLRALRDVTKKHGILLVFDEVITYRVGPAGLQGQLGIRPDLTTLGKIIGGRFPVGAIAGPAALIDEFDSRRPDAVAHGGTFNANPVTMVAGCAALDLLDIAEYTRLNNLAAQLARAVESALQHGGFPCQVNVAGSLFQVHLRADPVTDYRSLVSDPGAGKRAQAFAAELLKRGIVLSPNGLGCISSPMGPAEIAEFVSAAADAAGAVDFE
jgi:glutamate-1-semialdehyde 2,1-aminomutase